MTRSKIFVVSVALGAGTLAGALAQPAQADTINPLSFSVSTYYTGGTLSYCTSPSPCASGPSSATVSSVLPPSDLPNTDPNFYPYSGSAFATVIGSPIPELSVSAAASAAQLEPAGDEYEAFTFSAGASMTYYFELTQTAGSIYAGPVPVLMNGTSSLTSQVLDPDDTTSSSVSMTVGTVDNPSSLFSLPSTNDNPFFQSLDILPNVEYSVTMTADASAQVAASEDSNPSLAASASIDPTFTVSSDYADDFQLAFSSGIGNGVGAVPEPSSWAMMLIGFGGMGAAMRFRRKHSAATA
jgi:hypothetical protein